MDGGGISIMNKLRNLDAYPKINEDFYSRTFSGGIITVVSSVVMFLLFFSELRLYLNAATETKLVVDTSRGETLRINFDVTFPALPCSIVSLDAMDISGEQHLDVKHDIIKKRIDSNGNVIEARQDGIGAPKSYSKDKVQHVYAVVLLLALFSWSLYHFHSFLRRQFWPCGCFCSSSQKAKSADLMN
ncbi:hypothetical protein ACFE04_015036 [Oxalis oulophora]